MPDLDAEQPELKIAGGRNDRLSHDDLVYGQNNIWYDYNESSDVLVFVHGFFSESSRTWYYVDKKDSTKNRFWPDLIRQDQRLRDFALFLGGYYTGVDSGDYGFDNCADELFRAMQRHDEHSHEPVIAKERIVFICHSMGGIVVRYLLERNWEAFKDKRIGLVLIASPSYGSTLADRLAWLADFYGQKQGKKLKWKDDSLKDLDSRFRDLVHSRRLPGLFGVEACENHFIVHRRLLPDKRVVVTEESAGRYFGAAKMLRGTNHFTVVKPNSIHHPAHELLVDFWQEFKSKNRVNAEFNRILGDDENVVHDKQSTIHQEALIESEINLDAKPNKISIIKVEVFGQTASITFDKSISIEQVISIIQVD